MAIAFFKYMGGIKMNEIMLATDPESFTEYLQWFFSAKTQKFLIPWVILSVLIWTFIRKGKLTDSNKNIDKAIAEGRVIKATLSDKFISKADYYGTRDNHARHFKYAYTHPLSGKTKHYIYEMQSSGATPPDEIEIYYNEAGKVFGDKEESRRAFFWTVFGIGVPFFLSVIINTFF